MQHTQTRTHTTIQSLHIHYGQCRCIMLVGINVRAFLVNSALSLCMYLNAGILTHKHMHTQTYTHYAYITMLADMVSIGQDGSDINTCV